MTNIGLTIPLLLLLFCLPTAHQYKKQEHVHGLISSSLADHPTDARKLVTAIWYVEVKCAKGCLGNNVPKVVALGNNIPKVVANFTPDKPADAGKFALNIMPDLEEKTGFLGIGKRENNVELEVNVKSVDKINGQYRSATWKLKDSDLNFGPGYHFQMGHFRPSHSQAKGLYLSIQFTKSFDELPAVSEGEVAHKFANYQAVLVGGKQFLSVKILDEEEWKELKPFEMQLQDPEVIKQTFDKWKFDWPWNSLENKKVADYIRANSNLNMQFYVKRLPSCKICAEENDSKKRKSMKKEPVLKLKCGHYFHEKCLKEKLAVLKCPIPTCQQEIEMKMVKENILSKKEVPKIIFHEDNNKINDIHVFDIELKRPILQNGEAPFYTYKFDPSKKKSSWSSKDITPKQNCEENHYNCIEFIPEVPKQESSGIRSANRMGAPPVTIPRKNGGIRESHSGADGSETREQPAGVRYTAEQKKKQKVAGTSEPEVQMLMASEDGKKDAEKTISIQINEPEANPTIKETHLAPPSPPKAVSDVKVKHGNAEASSHTAAAHEVKVPKAIPADVAVKNGNVEEASPSDAAASESAVQIKQQEEPVKKSHSRPPSPKTAADVKNGNMEKGSSSGAAANEEKHDEKEPGMPELEDENGNSYVPSPKSNEFVSTVVDLSDPYNLMNSIFETPYHPHES